jgi:hypothetical protein
MPGIRLLALGAIAASGAQAQVVRGVVRDSAGSMPISGVSIVARDSARAIVGSSRTGRDGTFEVRLARPAVTILATRIGFAPESTTVPPGDSSGVAHVRLAMFATAVPLNPVVIAEERRQIRQTRVMGLDLRTIGTDIITPTQIGASARGARNYIDAIRAHLPAGASVNERTLCVAMLRGALITGGQVCSMIFVDGIRVFDPETALNRAQPQWLDHAIFLRPNDATVRFGTDAAAGALLLFTKHGGYALDRP